MKYLYSRFLQGEVEPPKQTKKRAPKKPAQKPPTPKSAAPKPVASSSKPQPQSQPPQYQPQTVKTPIPPSNASTIKPLPSPSELQQAIKNGGQTSGVKKISRPSAGVVSNANLTSTPNSFNPIPPPNSIKENTNVASVEKRNNKENTNNESTQPAPNQPTNKQQTTNAQISSVEIVAKPKETSSTSTTAKNPESAQKPPTSKSVEQSKVSDQKSKVVPLNEATRRSRQTKKPKMSSEEDPIEESQTTKKEATASKSTRTRSTSSTKEKEKPESTPKKAGRPPLKTSEKKQPAKRGRKRVIESENEDEDEDDIPQQTRKRKATVRRQNKELPILNGTYKLSMVFQGHTDINVPVKSLDDDDLEDAKDIWCCEFEPPRPKQLVHNVVAICGSYSVLFLDTQQGRYIKKYTHAEIQEIFYCMAWNTLSGPDLLNSDASTDESCNILAVAGRLGSIKLLNPLQNECYRYLFGHNQAVLKLAFAKTEPRWLFSASADKTVRLWDIGSPTSKDDDSVCLAKFNLPPKTSVPSALHVSHDLSTLIVGFDDGDMVNFKISAQLLEKFRAKSASLRIKESKTGDKWHDFGPIATIEPKAVYPKGEEWHAGYIDDIYIFGQDGNKANRLYNKILSRGADDMEFIIWDPVKSTKSDAEIMVALEWPDSAGCTGARFKVIEAEGQKILLAGEYDGQVYIYNIGDMENSKTLADGSLEQYKPTRMLTHPMSSELIRDVCCSHDTRTIVAVDNNNTAFIWNCTDNNN